MRPFISAVSLFLSLAAPALAGAGYSPQTLTAIVARAETLSEQKRVPVVVFDLDDTLFETVRRNFVLYREFTARADVRERWPTETRLLRTLTPSLVQYSYVETAAAVGVRDPEFMKAYTEFWTKRFFSDEYVTLDRPTPGAAEYVRRLARNGARVIYLTGRSEEKMRAGTIRALRANGFPLGRDAELILKPEGAPNDVEFKRNAVARIRAAGETVAIFENEPANLNALSEAFPDAHPVFVDTRSSQDASANPVQVHPRAVWVKTFLCP